MGTSSASHKRSGQRFECWVACIAVDFAADSACDSLREVNDELRRELLNSSTDELRRWIQNSGTPTFLRGPAARVLQKPTLTKAREGCARHSTVGAESSIRMGALPAQWVKAA